MRKNHPNALFVGGWVWPQLRFITKGAKRSSAFAYYVYWVGIAQHTPPPRAVSERDAEMHFCRCTLLLLLLLPGDGARVYMCSNNEARTLCAARFDQVPMN